VDFADKNMSSEDSADPSAKLAVTGPAIDARGILLPALFWAVLIIVALWLRLPELGKLGLWGDEGYTAIAVKAILEHGYPLLPSGGIYLRSVPILYVDALAAKIFGLNEFALRLPSVIASVGAIWMTYLLGKALVGRTVGLTAAVMMVFAGWEIEFSRHARMYAAFQFAFLSSLYLFYRGFIDGHKPAKWLMIPVWILTMMVHELGVVLAVVFLVLPVVKNSSLMRPLSAFAGFFFFGVLGVTIAQLVRAARFAAAESAIEAEVVTTGVINHAGLPFEHLLEVIEATQRFGYSTILLGLVATAIVIAQSLREPQHRWQYLSLIPLVAACVVGQLGLASLFLMFYGCLFVKQLQGWREAPFVAGIGIVALSSIGWVLSAWTTGLSATSSIRLFFDYPYVYERFVKFFLADWPIEIGLAALGAIVLWKRYITDRDSGAVFALLSMVGPILIVSLIPRSDDSARYSFHLYPLILMWAAVAIVYLALRFLPGRSTSFKVAGLTVILLLVPSDMELFHTLGIGRREYGHAFTRPHIASSRAFPFYPDYKTPAEYITTHLKADDVIISMRETIPFYYLGRMDYLWDPEKNTKTPGLGVRLLDRVHLQELLTRRPGTRIWFLADAFRLRKRQSENRSSAAFLNSIAECTVYRGRDHQTAVYLFSSDVDGRLFCIEQPARYPAST
jgi:4-amino-4-deoxy-L-arabinose transferase-like glycosyltransferase